MNATVKQENRYKKLIQSIAQAKNDRKRELEALTMIRGPRKPIHNPLPLHTRRQVRIWMRTNAEGFENATQLAEAANAALRLQDGALDDETHWVWEEALAALEWFYPDRPE